MCMCVCVYACDYNTRHGVWIVSSQIQKGETNMDNPFTVRTNRVVVSEVNCIGYIENIKVREAYVLFTCNLNIQLASALKSN